LYLFILKGFDFCKVHTYFIHMVYGGCLAKPWFSHDMLRIYFNKKYETLQSIHILSQLRAEYLVAEFIYWVTDPKRLPKPSFALFLSSLIILLLATTTSSSLLPSMFSMIFSIVICVCKNRCRALFDKSCFSARTPARKVARWEEMVW